MVTPEEKKLLGAKGFKGKEGGGGGQVWVFFRNTQSKRALQKINLDFKLKKKVISTGWLVLCWFSGDLVSLLLSFSLRYKDRSSKSSIGSIEFEKTNLIGHLRNFFGSITKLNRTQTFDLVQLGFTSINFDYWTVRVVTPGYSPQIDTNEKRFHNRKKIYIIILITKLNETSS